jgi:Tfp pilus assembly protein PilP
MAALRRRFSFLVSLVTVSFIMATVVAQTPPPEAQTETVAGSEIQQTLEDLLDESTTTDTYRYDPQGRRDPFRSLIGPAPKIDTGQRPPGIRGFLIDEMKLQGVFKTRQGLTAMVSGPDNKGWQLRVGDRVLDGEVIRVTQNSVVFRQEVNDPTRIERYRERVMELAPSGARR